MQEKRLILGAIAGDIIGSVYEWDNKKTTDFDLFQSNSTFTDDSVLTVATMDALLKDRNYGKTYHSLGRAYFSKGYGPSFYKWLEFVNPQPYNSWGNGSAMRVSPVGWLDLTLNEILSEAERSAEVTHNHPEGIKGAQATAIAVFMARHGKDKKEIKQFVMDEFKYNLNRRIDDIRPNYKFDVSCQGSVPEAIIAFLESTDFESAIRLAVSIGGDSDTIASITGGIAEAYYKEIPNTIIKKVSAILDDNLMRIVKRFSKKYRMD